MSVGETVEKIDSPIPTRTRMAMKDPKSCMKDPARVAALHIPMPVAIKSL